jgi:hypothetical protein
VHTHQVFDKIKPKKTDLLESELKSKSVWHQHLLAMWAEHSYRLGLISSSGFGQFCFLVVFPALSISEAEAKGS